MADPDHPSPAARAYDPPTRLQLILCKKCFEGRSEPPEPPDADAARKADDATVAALLAIATETVADERERGRALDAKCGTLVGFTGLVLALTGAITPTLVGKGLGGVGQPVADSAFVVAIVCLLAAILLAIVGVLMPQKYRALGRDQLAAFSEPSRQVHGQMWVHQSMLGSLRDILAQDRPVNDCKAKLTQRVAGFLALAFAALAVDALILAIKQFGVS